MDIDIRTAKITDIPLLKEMEQGVIRAERPFDSTLGEDPISYYDLEGLLQNPKALVLVATHNERIVSCGYGLEKLARPYLNHTTYAYLGFMFTQPEYRGKGLNGLILARLRAWASEMGWAEIRLTVYNDNASAIRAYEKVGFKRHIIEMRWPNDA